MTINPVLILWVQVPCTSHVCTLSLYLMDDSIGSLGAFRAFTALQRCIFIISFSNWCNVQRNHHEEKNQGVMFMGDSMGSLGAFWTFIVLQINIVTILFSSLHNRQGNPMQKISLELLCLGVFFTCYTLSLSVINHSKGFFGTFWTSIVQQRNILFRRQCNMQRTPCEQNFRVTLHGSGKTSCTLF